MTSPLLTYYILLTTFLIYLILDGRALMLCCLAPFCQKKYYLKIFNDILPSWDANQTWLVFTIAGVYGAFPIFFGEIMSQYYSFCLIMLMLFILRGASIEFYIKSSSYKSFWLNTLSLSSCLLLFCQVALCAKLLDSKSSVFFALLPFFIWFNFTRACCFLFPIKHFNRISYVVGLLISSQFLFIMLDVSIWKNTLSSYVFIIRIALLISFLGFSIFKSPSKLFGQTLLFYVFFSNALFILNSRTMTMNIQSLESISQHSSYSSYFIINVFSIILLPMIATGLSMMKRIFMKNLDEMSY